MATEYDNEKRGVLFKNDKKGNDRAPDYKGEAQIEGVEYDLAAWLRTSQRTNQKFMSLSFERKDARQSQGGGAAPAPAPVVADEDIPF